MPAQKRDSEHDAQVAAMSALLETSSERAVEFDALQVLRGKFLNLMAGFDWYLAGLIAGHFAVNDADRFTTWVLGTMSTSEKMEVVRRILRQARESKGRSRALALLSELKEATEYRNFLAHAEISVRPPLMRDGSPLEYRRTKSTEESEGVIAADDVGVKLARARESFSELMLLTADRYDALIVQRRRPKP